MRKIFFKKTRNSSQGFSLIEIMVSLSIFLLIIGAVVLFSVRTIQAHSKSQAMQTAVDNARFAIETLNKKIRTSHDVADNDGDATQFLASSEIFFIDNVDGSKYCYKFDTDKIVVDQVPEESEATNCLHADFDNFRDVVGTADGKVIVTGSFFVKQTDPVTYDRGFVRTVVEISYNDTSTLVEEKDLVRMQSGVSLRDY